MNKSILIAYYSWSGNTRRIAERIHTLVGGTLFEIEPLEPYPTDYNVCVKQARKEISAGYRPPLARYCPNAETYELVFVGSPNWWSSIAPPVATFLEQTPLSGKSIAPFCSHGGGGAGRVAEDIAKLCPNSAMREALFVPGRGRSDTDARITSWVKRVVEETFPDSEIWFSDISI